MDIKRGYVKWTDEDGNKHKMRLEDYEKKYGPIKDDNDSDVQEGSEGVPFTELEDVELDKDSTTSY